MGCKISERCAPDGTKVGVYLQDDITLTPLYKLLNDLKTEWVGTPSTLSACCTAVEQVENLTAKTLTGCTKTITDRDITVTAESFQSYGYGWLTGETVDLLNGVPIPLPVAAVGDVIFLHMISGEQETGIAFDNSSIGKIDLENLPASIAAQTTISECDSSARFWGQIYAYNVVAAADGTQTLTAKANNPISTRDPLQGVIAWAWSKATPNDSLPLTVSDIVIGTAADDKWTDGRNQYTDSVMGPYESTTCPQMAWSTARHVLTNKDGFVNDIGPSEWATWTAGTELYDYNSCDQGSFDPCCGGLSLAYIPKGTSYEHFFKHNIADPASTREWTVVTTVDFACPNEVCTGGDPSLGATTISDVVEECDRTVMKVFRADATPNIPAGGSINLVPVLDGVDQVASQITMDDSTVAGPIEIQLNLGGYMEGETASCEFDLRMDVTSGDEANTSVELASPTLTLRQV